jgi:hypothetical protein
VQCKIADCVPGQRQYLKHQIIWQHSGRGVANDAHYSRLLIADPVQEDRKS